MDKECVVVTNPMIAANRSSEVTLSKFLRVIRPSFSDITVVGGNLRLEPDLKDVARISFQMQRAQGKLRRVWDFFLLQCKMYGTLCRLVRKGTPVFFWLADKMILPFWAVKRKAGIIYYFVYGNVIKEAPDSLFARCSSGMIRYMAEHADHTCVESPAVLTDWDQLQARNIKICHLYVNSVGLNPLEDREPVLGMVCRLAAGKHVQETISAMTVLHEVYPDWRLEIIGTGKQRELCEKLIREQNTQSYISMLGWVEHDKIADCCRSWSWLLFPTDAEGLPNGLLEMMGRGIPALASPVGGIRDLIRDGENGFYLSGTTEEAISQGIRQILAIDKTEYESCCQNALRTISGKYSLEAAAKHAQQQLLEKSERML